MICTMDYVFSLGERPDDAAWTGFQNYHPGKDFGYLTIFREIDNSEQTKILQLRFLKNVDLELKDLVTGETKQYAQMKKGMQYLKASNPHHSGFINTLFCKYLYYCIKSTLIVFTVFSDSKRIEVIAILYNFPLLSTAFQDCPYCPCV